MQGKGNKTQSRNFEAINKGPMSNEKLQSSG